MKSDKICPIFIFSLPRTGSTLLQRILVAHKGISSLAEPHFLLPIVNMTKAEGMISYYSHQSTLKGIEDFVKFLPGGEETFYDRLHRFSIDLYQDLAEEGDFYFVDKTPRYVYIIDEIAKIFPEAKFIFLFRSPIQVYASLMETFCDGKFFKMYRWKNFLHTGFNSLSDSYRKMRSKSVAMKYEEFINNPEDEIKKIFDYLEVERDISVLSSFDLVDLRGASVDPTGTKMYHRIEKGPLVKWHKTFNSRFRKYIVKRYLKQLPESNLEIQGYNRNELFQEIDEFKTNKLVTRFSDFTDLIKSKLVLLFHLNLFFDSKLTWTRNQYLN